jgi:hypothetical protein
VLRHRVGSVQSPRAVYFPPTDQDLEVQRLLHDRLGDHLRAVDALVAGDVAAFNALLESKGMGGIGG